MSGLRIRPATAADGDTMLSLIDGIADYEKLPRPDAAARARFVVHLGESARFSAIIAEADGGAIGYALWVETYSTFSGSPKLFLEDIFVIPEARGTGVGRALFLEVVREAGRRGCNAIDWEVLDWNEPAKEFYRRLGGEPKTAWEIWRLGREEIERLVTAGGGEGTPGRGS